MQSSFEQQNDLALTDIGAELKITNSLLREVAQEIKYLVKVVSLHYGSGY